jgi:hypothetical protein
MKKTRLARFALLGVGCMAFHNADAGCAVACDGLGHFATAYGGPVEREKERALESAHRKGWMGARIVAATDLIGYGAIAVGLHPNGIGSVNAISVGKRSATEAQTVAIKQCLEAGGRNPKIRWAWRG